jgi:hypothetical protein
MSPKSAPKSIVEMIVMNTSSSVNSVKIKPMKRPNQMPESTPPIATRPVVSRPVIRSMRLRSVPTIMHCSTGNLLSDRKSTAFWAAA